MQLRRMFLLTLALKLGLTGALAAEPISIWVAQISGGSLLVVGQASDLNAPILLDGRFSEETDKGGRFLFRISYHPTACLVTLKATSHAQVVVIANCESQGNPSNLRQNATSTTNAAAEPAAQANKGEAPASPNIVLAPARTAPSAADLARPTEKPETPVINCGSASALYVGDNGMQASVQRRGSVRLDDPLKPALAKLAIVIETTVDGRTMTVFLRRGPPCRIDRLS